MGITVFVPMGILDGQAAEKRSRIVESVHGWISDNRLSLRDGEHRYQCDIPEMSAVTGTQRVGAFGRLHMGKYIGHAPKCPPRQRIRSNRICIKDSLL